MSARRRSLTRLALACGAALIALSTPAAHVAATPSTAGAVRDPEVLRAAIVRLFDRLDQVGRMVERLRVEMQRVDRRIADMSRQVVAEQQLLNDRAAEAYMAGRAGQIESVLGAISLRDLQDAFLFLEAVSQNDHDLLVSLQHRRGELEVQRQRLEALAEELRGKRSWLERTAADLAERLRRQQVRAARTSGVTATPRSADAIAGPVTSSVSFDPGPPSGREAISRLIRERFAALGSATTSIALCVAERESGFDPAAVNSATRAAGLFQFLPSTWATLSDLAGWMGASVFDARANASVAAWTVSHYGWHPWKSVSGRCGV